jgi:hypothetical protein
MAPRTHRSALRRLAQVRRLEGEEEAASVFLLASSEGALGGAHRASLFEFRLIFAALQRAALSAATAAIRAAAKGGADATASASSQGEPQPSPASAVPMLAQSPPCDQQFPVNHFLGTRACAACLRPEVRKRAAATNKQLILYVHVPKTGGSTLECATEGRPVGWRWVNMGHTSQKALHDCTRACTVPQLAPRLVISVREPFSWWQSNFCFSWTEPHNKLRPPASVADFPSFMRWVGSGPFGLLFVWARRLLWAFCSDGGGLFFQVESVPVMERAKTFSWSQSELVNLTCGTPCK